MKQNISGKTALVTGAGAGIGKDMAIRLSQLGVHLHLCGRTLSKLEETKSLCNDQVNVYLHQVELKDEKQIWAMMEKIDTLDFLINNAGMIATGGLEEISTEVMDELYQTNVRAPFIMIQSALPLLRQSCCAEIINIGSVVSRKAYVDQCAYVTSKHALMGLTKACAKELASEHIRVHILCPGGIRTEMVAKARPDLANEPVIMPEDISDVIEFWLTHRSNAIIDEIDIHREGKEPFQ